MVNQKKDRLLNDYLSPMDITATQFRVLCSIRCEVCITPVELKTVLRRPGRDDAYARPPGV